jgi:hypothetical protein
MVTAVKGSVAIVVIAAALPLVVAVLLMAGTFASAWRLRAGTGWASKKKAAISAPENICSV